MERWFHVLIALVLVAGFEAGARHAEASTLDLLGVGWANQQGTVRQVTVVINAAGGVTAEAVADVASAVEDWNAALAGINAPLHLNLVSGVKRADIVIHMKVGGGSVLGQTLPKTATRFSCALKGASIQLSGKAFGQSFSSAGTANVARHELGHALGLGHSDDSNDLMYAAAEASDVFGDTPVPISACDKKGLDAIYPLPNTCEIADSVSCP